MDTNELRKLVENGYNYPMLRKHFGVVDSTITYWLKKCNFVLKRRHRNGAVWKPSKKQMEHLVDKSATLSEILRKCGLNNKGGNIRSLKKRLKEDDIDYSHIRMGADSNRGRKFPRKKIPLKEILVEGSTYSRGHLKKRIIDNEIIRYNCSECEITSSWNGHKLVLVLDHINGTSNDNRIENLRFLCPNCNSQQPTFAGRNRKHSAP